MQRSVSEYCTASVANVQQEGEEYRYTVAIKGNKVKYKENDKTGKCEVDQVYINAYLAEFSEGEAMVYDHWDQIKITIYE